jgi:hypothetical protein
MMERNVRKHIQFLLHAEIGISYFEGFTQLYFTLKLHLSQSEGYWSSCSISITYLLELILFAWNIGPVMLHLTVSHYLCLI